jgi:putative membrane protein
MPSEKQPIMRFLFPRLPVMRRLLIVVIGVSAYTAAVDWLLAALSFQFPADWAGTEATVLQGLVVGLLLAFRNSEAARRWWDARSLWGQLVNDTRNLAIKTRAHVTGDAAGQQRLGLLLASFAVALSRHLRDGCRLRELPGWEGTADDPRHVPLYLAGQVHEQLANWQRQQQIDGYGLLVLDKHARGLMDVCGACEKIRYTPVPGSYRALLRHGTTLYIALIPWYLSPDMGYSCVPVVALVAYFLYGVELTAEDVEEPFGRAGDDLDTDGFCRTIATGVEAGLSGGKTL